MTHPVEFLYDNATHVVKPYMTTSPTDGSEHCAVCARTCHEWGNPDEKVHGKDVYGTISDWCLPCYSLIQGSMPLFGVEKGELKTDKKGQTKDSRIPMKLGMAIGLGMLVGEGKAYMIASDKVMNRIGQATEPPFEIIYRSDLKADGVRELDWVRDNAPSEPFLYISNFGRKKKSLVDSLTMSDRETIFRCSQDGTERIDMALFRDLAESKDRIGSSKFDAIRKTLKAIYEGRLDPDSETTINALKSLKDRDQALFETITQRMPDDPHECIDLISAV